MCTSGKTSRVARSRSSRGRGYRIYAIMHCVHMRVDVVACKKSHTDPTNMRSAFALHMITALRLLNPNFAFRTSLESILASQLLIEPFLFCRITLDSPFCASHSIVPFFMTGGTHSCKA